METYTSPVPLSNIFGAAQIGYPDPKVIELEPNKGVLLRGSVIVLNAGGKGELVTATTQNNAYGILLRGVDTATEFTASVGRRGSYKASQLIVSAGVNAATLTAALRQASVFLQGDLVVPVAAMMEAEAPAPEPAA